MAMGGGGGGGGAIGGRGLPNAAAVGAVAGAAAGVAGAIQDEASGKDCCEAERQALKTAKENNPGQCLSRDSKATLQYKLLRLQELLRARMAAFECIGDGDAEHMRQISEVQRMVNECSRRLGE